MTELSKELVQEAEVAIHQLWSHVIQAATKILTADGHFGFARIEANLNPKIEDMLLGLQVIEAAFDAVLQSEVLIHEHDIVRMALNGKQSVLHIKALAAALKGNDEEAYRAAIRALDTQPKI